jgi:hypothetical protein
MTWATPSTFTVTIPSQLTGDGLRVRTSTAAGAVSTFSSCDNTVHFRCRLIKCNYRCCSFLVSIDLVLAR